MSTPHIPAPAPAQRTNVTAPNDTLIPRSELIAQLTTLLDTHTQLCVVGLPGAGKSSLARMISSNTTRYQAVLWHTFGAHDDAQHDTDIYTKWLCCLLQCAMLPRKILPNAATLQKQFARFPRRLVIFDDVHSAQQLRTFLAALPTGTHVLVTTRSISVAHDLHWNMMQIGAMTTHDAQALLAHQLATALDNVRQWPWVDDMIRAVDGHPLALKLIAQRLRMLSPHAVKWADFVQPILQGIPQQAFSDFALHPDIASGFVTLFAANYHTLNTLERPILHSIAICDPDHPVSTRLLMAMWHLNEDQITMTMHDLSEKLFVIAHPNGWAQHPIMHSYTHIQITRHNAEHQLQTKLIDALIQLLATHHAQGTYHDFEDDYPQCVNALTRAMTHDIARAFTLMHALSAYLLATGQYLNLHQKSLMLLTHVQKSGDDALIARVFALCAMTAFEYAVHVGTQRTHYLRQGYQFLQTAKELNPDPHDQLAAEITMRIGVLLGEIANLEGHYSLQEINAAIKLYAQVAEAPGLDAILYSQLCQNRANVYLRRAEIHPATSIDDCQKAIEYCHKGLAWIPTQDTAHLYIGLQMTLSSAYALYATLPTIDTAEHLHQALIASQEALTRLNKVQQPARYAHVLMNHANLLSELSTCIDTNQKAHIHDALADYQEALSHRTVTNAPDDYAWTQHNRADALRIAANIVGEPALTHFHEAWIAIHEALRLRTRRKNWWNHALTHYVRAHIAMEYAEALCSVDETRAHAIIDDGLASYHAIYALQKEINIPMNMLLGISDYASMLYGLRAWIIPETATENLQTALQLNATVRAQYPPDAFDDQAEALAHRIQLHHWSWMLSTKTPDTVADVVAAERLCDMQLRPLIACQLHMRMGIFASDVHLAEYSRGPVYHIHQAHALARRLNYAPVPRMLPE